MASQCIIVGGGPAGVMLGLLLARRGVGVSLLEAHDDFDRMFRGDTVHPSSLELLDQLGLASRLLELDHARLERMTLRSGDTQTTVADFSRLATPFPFIAMIPQTRFLELLIDEARRHDSFELHMGARVEELLREDDVVCGVRYRQRGETKTLRGDLTVGTDGRASQVRKLAGFVPRKLGAPMDVLWLVLPRDPGESASGLTGFRVGRGRLVVVLARADAWQLGYVILKGDGRTVREAGLDALRNEVASLVPELADRVDAIENWPDVHFLSVESSRVPRWHRPGLLVIGDAAHVMSPVGGVGINYAIQDAVATANLLARPLLEGALDERHLAAVQRRREWPTRFIQSVQTVMQRQLVARALRDAPFRLPWPARVLPRIPLLRNVPARMVGWGVRPERIA